MPSVVIEFERRDIPVESLEPTKVPDKDWRYVDGHGHGHFWDLRFKGADANKLPTLTYVVEGTRWVGDPTDLSWEVEYGNYHCRQCDEVVVPGMIATYGPRFIPGPAYFRVSIQLANGLNQIFLLPEEGYDKALEKWAETMQGYCISSEVASGKF